MLRRLGIRAKVLAVLAVPMIVLLGLGVFITNLAFTDASDRSVVRGHRGRRSSLHAVWPPAIEYGAHVLAHRAGGRRSRRRAPTTDERTGATPRRHGVSSTCRPTPRSSSTSSSSRSSSSRPSFPTTRRAVDINSQTASIENGYGQIIDAQLYLVQLIAENLTDRDLAQFGDTYDELAPDQRQPGAGADRRKPHLVDQGRLACDDRRVRRPVDHHRAEPLGRSPGRRVAR